MKLWEKQALFVQNACKLLQFMAAKGLFPTFGEALRTPEQAKIYAEQGKGIVESLHIKKLALDVNLLDKDGKYLTQAKSYEEFGEFWEGLHKNNRWGGRFSRLVDCTHFEMQEL